MKDKIVVAVISALCGGALGGVLTAMNTAGRLTSIEGAIQRIELRLDATIKDAQR